MSTVNIIWENGRSSSESFRNNGEFYKYMKETTKDSGIYPSGLYTNDAGWITEGYDGDARGRTWVEMKISW